MRHRILVVGRDAELRARLARRLRAANYAIEIAESSAHARRIGFRGVALSIVAPAGLRPEVDGLVDELRTATGKTVLLVGSSGTLLDPASGVMDLADEAGLLARIHEALEPTPKVEERAPALRFSDYYLDLAGQSLFKQTGQEIELTWGEYRLLRAFVQRPGQVLSRDQLLQSLSGHDAEAYDRSIDMQVVRLRRKIELDPKCPRLIIAVRRSGYKFVAQVKEVEARTVGSVPEANCPPAPAQPQADRRQVTALCIELLSCNGFGTAGDPEELQSVMAAYRRQVTAVVAQHEGTVGHCVAGEVMAYFGHPVAQEHAAERAIHAALVLAEGLAGTSANRFPVRAGLATGLVVADPAGEVIGDAPGDAARMRSLAEAGQVVVTATTRQVGGQLFTYHAFQPVTANGVPHPATAWRVMGPRPVASRSEALYRGKSAPLVGRVEERTLLLHAWQQVTSGEGRVVLLTGEPGIGKNSLAQRT